ncbi:hypothetical protein D3C85_1568780 [compost metagenome]
MGLLTATAAMARMGDSHTFKAGREFDVWLAPSQIIAIPFAALTVSLEKAFESHDVYKNKTMWQARCDCARARARGDFPCRVRRIHACAASAGCIYGFIAILDVLR